MCEGSKMANFSRRGASYSALNNEETPPLGHLRDSINAAPTIITLDQDNEDSNVVIHKVPQTKGKEPQVVTCLVPGSSELLMMMVFDHVLFY